MKRTWVILISLLSTAAVLMWLLALPRSKQIIPSAPSPESAVSSTTQLSPRSLAVEKIQLALTTPITFYGRVIDQHGNPVADAMITYTALDKFDAPGSTYQGRSDAAGSFSLSGINGAVLTVGVQKEGYYMVDGQSAHSFGYAIGPDSTRREPPKMDDPAIFVLHKMGIAEPLVHVSSRTYRIARDGTPVEIDLTSGKPSAQGHVRVQAWTDDHDKAVKQHYNWRCRISVPQGGLIERQRPFDFEAPTDGYKPADEIVFTQTAERWRPQAERDYFVRLEDGRYARIRFKIIAQGNHFFRLESHLNPSGSRNLEFDPNKVVRLD